MSPMAMAAWPRLGTPSSLPTNSSPSSSSSTTTTTSSSSSSSSSSSPLPLTSHMPSVVDLLDKLWFFRSVLPLPSLSFPCLPSPFSSSHSLDSSTILAQLMSSSPTHYTPRMPSRRLPLSSSSSSSPSPRPQQQKEQLPLQNQSLHYAPWSFPSYQAYLPPSDGEHEENTEEGEEEEEPADLISDLDAHLDTEDALSGIYDVGVLLKDQHLKSRQGGLSATLQETWLQATPGEESGNTKTQVNSSKIEGLREFDAVEMTPLVSNVLDVFEDDGRCKSSTISYVPSHTEAWLISSTPFNFQVSALNEQVDMKEHLKLWAHAVASTLC